jgi:hypothetical protein
MQILQSDPQRPDHIIILKSRIRSYSQQLFCHFGYFRLSILPSTKPKSRSKHKQIHARPSSKRRADLSHFKAHEQINENLKEY